MKIRSVCALALSVVSLILVGCDGVESNPTVSSSLAETPFDKALNDLETSLLDDLVATRGDELANAKTFSEISDIIDEHLSGPISEFTLANQPNPLQMRIPAKVISHSGFI